MNMTGPKELDRIAIRYPYSASKKSSPGKIPNSDKVLVHNNREILIAPNSWVQSIEALQVPGYGTMRNVMATLGMIGSRTPTHEVLLQAQPSFPPHIIINAIEETLSIKIHNIERYYYPYNLDDAIMQIRSLNDALNVDAYLKKLAPKSN